MFICPEKTTFMYQFSRIRTTSTTAEVIPIWHPSAICRFRRFMCVGLRIGLDMDNEWRKKKWIGNYHNLFRLHNSKPMGRKKITRSARKNRKRTLEGKAREVPQRNRESRRQNRENLHQNQENLRQRVEVLRGKTKRTRKRKGLCSLFHVSLFLWWCLSFNSQQEETRQMKIRSRRVYIINSFELCMSSTISNVNAHRKWCICFRSILLLQYCCTHPLIIVFHRSTESRKCLSYIRYKLIFPV